LIPEQNVKDLSEIPDNIKNKLEIVPVRWIDEVLKVALERQPVSLNNEEILIDTKIPEKKGTEEMDSNMVQY